MKKNRPRDQEPDDAAELEAPPAEPASGNAGPSAGERARRLRAPGGRSRVRAFVAPVLLLAVALVLMLGAQSFGDLKAARARETALRDEIEATRRRIAALNERRERLLHDPALLERLAREELGWVLPDDTVVVLPDGSP